MSDLNPVVRYGIPVVLTFMFGPIAGALANAVLSEGEGGDAS